MFERYAYEPGVLTVSEPAWGEDETDQIEDINGFKIIDRHVGHGEDAWVGFTRDPDVAQQIIDLLNADDERQRVSKIVQAREVLGNEIVDTINPSRG